MIEFRVTAREMEQFLKYKVPVDLKKIQGEGAVMGESFVEMAVHKGLQPKESEKLNETLLHFFSRLKNAGAEFGSGVLMKSVLLWLLLIGLFRRGRKMK